jgi:uncharacterized protein (DUF433 family)
MQKPNKVVAARNKRERMMILEWMGSGATRDDILRSNSHLSADDLDEALKFAVQSVNHEFVADAEIAS